MINSEEKLIQELSCAYEQLSLFYDWNKEIAGKKGQDEFSTILSKLSNATNSDLGAIITMGRGRSLNCLAIFKKSDIDHDLAIKRFKTSLPDIESKLHWNYAITLPPTDTFNYHMIVVPWRSDSILKGVFLYSKSTDYTKQEITLLANASNEIVSRIEQSTLSRKLQDKNNELALYLVKDLSELKDILKNLKKIETYNHDTIKNSIPEGLTAYSLIMGVVNFSTDIESTNKLAENIFPTEVVKAIQQHQEGSFESGMDSYLIKTIDPQEPTLGCLITKRKSDSPKQHSELLLNLYYNFYKRSHSLEQTNMAIQRLYNSHLLSMSKLVDAMHPVLSARSDNAQYVVNLLSNSLGLSANKRETLEVSAMLSDISLIYLEKRALEEYLLKGTVVSGTDTLKKIREHPLKSAEMIAPVKSLSECAEVIKWHHERWDGYGYPDGLKGENIPKLSRILSVVQGLTSRSIHYYMNVDDLLSNPIERDWLLKQSGKAYDPAVIDALFNAVGI